MRNRLIHGYDTVDLDVLWDVIQIDLPTLIIECAGFWGRLPDGTPLGAIVMLCSSLAMSGPNAAAETWLVVAAITLAITGITVGMLFRRRIPPSRVVLERWLREQGMELVSARW